MADSNVYNINLKDGNAPNYSIMQGAVSNFTLNWFYILEEHSIVVDTATTQLLETEEDAAMEATFRGDVATQNSAVTLFSSTSERKAHLSPQNLG